MPNRNKKILLTGATGYVGGRLLTALEGAGYRVRCLARRPEHLRPRAGENTEIVRGDLLDPPSLEDALRDVDTAFYLVHSMAAGKSFEADDRRAAVNFGRAARQAGIRRIIYLGGLGSGSDLSPHLTSRQEVGEILRLSGVPTLEFRASIIIGSGSLSFEMIRALVEKLPVMVTPRWVRMRAQPIAIEDVIDYLVAALERDIDGSPIIQIGGADRVSYRQIMKEYGRQRKLKRLFISVPVLTPRLSSLWLGLVTPVYARVGRQLIDSLPHETVVEDDRAAALFPDIKPRGIRAAVERALRNEDAQFARTRFSDALSAVGRIRNWGGIKFGSRIVDSRSSRIACPPHVAFRVIRRIGGDTGWYFANPLWRLRGFLDLLLGGVGMRRGRRDPEYLRPGDTVDFWRVQAIEPDRFLRLHAEMKVPGRAWLQFEVIPDGQGSIVRQTAIFDPVGLTGLFYWYLLYPLHNVVFSGMLRAIARRAGGHRADASRPADRVLPETLL